MEASEPKGDDHVTRHLTTVSLPVYPNHTDRSVCINEQTLPYLVQETQQAQSASVDLVSRATDTSDASVQSLQSALQEGGMTVAAADFAIDAGARSPCPFGDRVRFGLRFLV